MKMAMLLVEYCYGEVKGRWQGRQVDSIWRFGTIISSVSRFCTRSYKPWSGFVGRCVDLVVMRNVLALENFYVSIQCPTAHDCERRRRRASAHRGGRGAVNQRPFGTSILWLQQMTLNESYLSLICLADHQLSDTSTTVPLRDMMYASNLCMHLLD